MPTAAISRERRQSEVSSVSAQQLPPAGAYLERVCEGNYSPLSAVDLNESAALRI